MSHVFVTDCSGFAHMRPPDEPDEGREAALRKGMRAALGRWDWSPGNLRPTPVPAYLKVDVVVNKKEVRWSWSCLKVDVVGYKEVGWGWSCACGGGGGDGGCGGDGSTAG